MNTEPPQPAKSEEARTTVSAVKPFWKEVARGVITAIIVALFLALPFKAFASWTLKAFESRSLPPVGTVVASFLSPSQFGTDNKGEWVPVEGQEISNESKLYKLTRRSRLPDMRGVFTRGLNEFTPGSFRGDLYADPEGSRTAGHLQTDGFMKHSHAAAIETAEYPHKAQGGNFAPLIAVMRRTSEEGGSETRPKNIAVYYYIRIN